MDSSIKCFLLCFVSFATYGSDISLMLSPAEEGALTRAQEQSHKKGDKDVKNSEKLRLDGIIFSHQNSWTIWLNGRSIKQGQKIDTLRIVMVTPDTVDLVWCPKPGGESYEISLKPNEVFQASSLIP